MHREIILTFLLTSIRLSSGLLPSSIKVCIRNDPNLSDCMINSIENLRPNLIKGDLGDGVKTPPLEPFVIDVFAIGESQDFQLTFKKTIVRGPGSFQIDKLSTNIADLKFDVLVTFPKLDIKGQYDLSLRLLGTPLKSQGDILIKLENYHAKINLRATKYVKNGHTHLKFEKFNLKIQQGKIILFKLTNLFNGNKNFEKAANTLFEQNSQFMFDNVYPSLEKKLSELFTNIGNKYSEIATFDELFPIK